MLRAGIVGLPNVGKSTLFNAITRTRNAEAENYPFCTIDPNVGIVSVPDARLAELQRIAKTNVVIPAAIEFVDIAGLVKGASTGEGLGNKFLTHIREVDAVVQVVRCFDDPDVHHVSGAIDPVRDIEVINTELMLADLEVVQKRRERLAKDAKRGDKGAVAEDAVLGKIEAAIDEGKPALTVDLSPEERALSAPFFLLSDKPTIFACNVKEGDLATADTNPYVMKVRDYVKTHLSCEAVVISAQIESDLVDLAPDEADAFLKELGVQESGIGALILWSSFGIMRETLNILLEGTPRSMKLERVEAAIRGIDGVNDVHDLHVWSLGSETSALSCHISIADIPPSASERILREVKECLHRDFRIDHTTIQFENVVCEVAHGCVIPVQEEHSH
jgi:GTP-binding protein YchF